MALNGIVGQSPVGEFLVGGAAISFYSANAQFFAQQVVQNDYFYFDSYRAHTNKLSTWRKVTWDEVTPVGTSVFVSVLDENNNVLLANIASGTDISSIGGSYIGPIKVKVTVTANTSSASVDNLRVGFKPARLGDWRGDRTLILAENFGNVFEDPVSSNKYLDTLNSTATIDLNAHTFTGVVNGVKTLISKEIYKSNKPVIAVTINADETVPVDTSISWEASTDNGTTWQPIVLGSYNALGTPGLSLSYRITFTGVSAASPPVVTGPVQIQYELSP